MHIFIDLIRFGYQRRRDTTNNGEKYFQISRTLLSLMVPLTCGRKSVILEHNIGFVVFPKVLLEKTSVNSTPWLILVSNNYHYITFTFSTEMENMR